MFGCDAWTIVDDRHRGAIAMAARSLGFIPRQRNVYRAAVATVFDGVLDEIVEDLKKFIAIAQGDERRRHRFDGDRHTSFIRSRSEGSYDVFNQIVEIDAARRLQVRFFFDATEQKQIID